MVGASAAAAGESGLVPAPQAGDQDKFLRGDKTWVTINTPTFDTNIFEFNNANQITLKGYSLAEGGTILSKNNLGQIQWVNRPSGSGLSREIITLTDLQDKLEDGTYDTSIIYMVKVSDDNSSINKYDEYIVVNGQLEKFGSIQDSINLNDYVTNTVFQQAIGNLNDLLYDTQDSTTGNLIPGVITRLTTVENIFQNKVGNLDLLLSQDNPTLVDKISEMDFAIGDLSDRLQWHELINNE